MRNCLSHSTFVCHTHICLSHPLICPRNCLSHSAFVCPTHTFHSSCNWCRYICMQPIGNVSWSISSSFNHFMSVIFVFSFSVMWHDKQTFEFKFFLLTHHHSKQLTTGKWVTDGRRLLHRDNSVLCGPRTVGLVTGDLRVFLVTPHPSPANLHP